MTSELSEATMSELVTRARSLNMDSDAAKEVLGELLEMARVILNDVADHDGDLDEARALLRRRVNRYRRKFWRDHAKPILKGLEDDEWVEDALLAITLLEMLVKKL